MFGGILDAIMESQITIGTQMATDAQSAQKISTMTVDLANEWMGPSEVIDTQHLNELQPIDVYDLKNGYWYYAANDSGHKHMLWRPPVMGSSTTGNEGMPLPGINLFTQEIQTALNYIAQEEQASGISGDTLKQLEAERQTWTSLSSQMGNIKDLQSSPLTTAKQAELAAVQGDNSEVTGAAQEGEGLSDLDAILSNIIGNLK